MKNNNQIKILIVDDEPNMGWLFKQSLCDKYDVFTTESWVEGKKVFEKEKPKVVFLDLRMPKIDGLTALKEIKSLKSETQVIMITAYASVPNAVEAMKIGAFDYLEKPFSMEKAQKIILKALDAQKLASTKPKEKTMILGNSPQILNLIETIDKIAPTNANVLLLGESGTGKELVAHEIHQKSTRRNKPFVAINCAAVPESLMESELFGYEKGAFTGAAARKPGKFEEADEGTLMLDEIADMPLFLQGKLLRALEQKEFERLGGIKPISVDVRVISATNRNLEEMAANNEFRSDLFYRLAVLPLTIPPLRERREDIKILSYHFLEEFSNKYEKNFHDFSPAALEILLNYDWPGNVRELKNMMEQIVILNDDETVKPKHLPERLIKQKEEKEVTEILDLNSLKRKKELMIDELERKEICAALAHFNGNRTKAARYLKISTRSLQLKIKKLNITEKDYGML